MYEDKPTNQQRRQKIFGLNQVTKEYNRKAKWKNNMEEELQGLKSFEAEIFLESLKIAIKMLPNWKMLGRDSIHRLWF